MLKIGITGGIGSGKSIVCKIFSQLGIPVYDADSAAKQIMHSDEELIAQLKSIFGSAVYNSKDELNRTTLAEIVFNNKEALMNLNNLVHPAVKKDFEKWAALNGAATYIIKEAAILFESGSNKDLDYVIAVTAPEEIRFKRVMQRDNVSMEHVQSIAKNQMIEGERKEKSDFIITNNDDQLVIPQVLKLHHHFLSLTKNKK